MMVQVFYHCDTGAQPGANVIKLVVSQSICPWQAFQALSNKHSSLLRKLVNFGQIFYNIGPSWTQYHKTIC